MYEFNFMEQPRDRGFYKLSMSAGSQDKRLVGTNGAEVSVKVLTDVSVEDVQVAVFDREHTQATNSHSYVFRSIWLFYTHNFSLIVKSVL